MEHSVPSVVVRFGEAEADPSGGLGDRRDGVAVGRAPGEEHDPGTRVGSQARARRLAGAYRHPDRTRGSQLMQAAVI